MIDLKGDRTMKSKPLSAFIMECSADEGYTKEDITHMLDAVLDVGKTDYLPILLEADNSEAFGFIRMEDADTVLDFRIEQNSDFGKAICAILNDKNLETPDGLYDICGLKVRILQKGN